MVQKFDIAIIGAGPAGSAAAINAIEKGYSCCVFEKKKIGADGRYKACGGALAWEIVEELNYPEALIERIVESLELHHIQGEIYTKIGKGAVVWRSTFDKFLIDQASNQGVTIYDEDPIIQIEEIDQEFRIRSKQNTVIAKYIIAADGVYSKTLNLLNWPPFKNTDLVMTITQEMCLRNEKISDNLGKDQLHLFFGIQDFIPMGYAWLFPKNNAVTVGWGNLLSSIQNTKEEFKRFLEIPFVQQALKGSNMEIFQPHLIPVNIREKLYDNRIFAVGDAAGFVDPISGKGIPYALLSGRIAIDSLDYCEKKNKLDKIGVNFQRKIDEAFLIGLKLKRKLREKIFLNDDSLKQFLELWQNHHSSEIISHNLM